MWKILRKSLMLSCSIEFYTLTSTFYFAVYIYLCFLKPTIPIHCMYKICLKSCLRFDLFLMRGGKQSSRSRTPSEKSVNVLIKKLQKFLTVYDDGVPHTIKKSVKFSPTLRMQVASSEWSENHALFAVVAWNGYYI